MIPNIVITGAAGAGKSTVADFLINQLDVGFERISFAEPLKVMLGTSTDRERLQEFGTDVVRRYEPNAWIRLFEWNLAFRKRIGEHKRLLGHKPPKFVTDDCRFPNELQMLKDWSWCHVNVTASRRVRVERLRLNGKLQDEAQLDHISERALDEMVPDYTIVNDGDLEDLDGAVVTIMELIDRER